MQWEKLKRIIFVNGEPVESGFTAEATLCLEDSDDKVAQTIVFKVLWAKKLPYGSYIFEVIMDER